MLFLQSPRSESWSFASYVCRFFLFFFFSFFFVHLFSRDRFLFLSLFVSLDSLGPSLRLILSRVYLIALTKRELSSRRCPLQLLLADLGCRYPFFSRYTRRCKFLCPPVYPPVQIAENYLASPPRSPPTFLDACRSSIFYPAVPLLRKLFFETFSRLISLVTRQATFSSIRTTARGFSVLQ